MWSFRRERLNKLKLLAVAVAAIFSTQGSVAEDQAAGGFQLTTGVVVDSNLGRAYVASPSSQIVALDLDSGKVLWRSEQASKPLALWRNLLMSQAQVPPASTDLKVVGLDAQTGSKTFEKTVPLPGDVTPSIVPGLSKSFVVMAKPRANELAVSWEYDERPASGVAPGSPASYLGNSFDVQSPFATEDSVAEPHAIPARAGTGSRVIKTGAFAIEFPSGNLNSEPAPPPGSLHASMALQFAPMSMAPQGAGIPTSVSTGSSVASADLRYVLTSQLVADSSTWQKYLWTVYDRQTGVEIGRFRAHEAFAPFVVKDSRLIFQTGPFVVRHDGTLEEQPIQLRAVKVGSGELVWSQPMLDLTPRGPFPP